MFTYVCYIKYPRVRNRDDPWVTVTRLNPRGQVQGSSELEDPLQPSTFGNLSAAEDLAGVGLVAEENDGEPVDDLALMRRAYTNKKAGQIDDGLVRDVADLVQTQVVDEVSQLQTEDDASTASTNLSRFRINEIVESSVPKKKRRLVGLGRHSARLFFFFDHRHMLIRSSYGSFEGQG
uniref:DUF4216 domain-containing protein n=1 Tax=Brassica oleracea TaxID=3712 RepID=A0A3P6EFU4_BRAOL|nr:unnamed protein product [Brassica oleracea]